MSTDNVLSADNQQANRKLLRISDDYLAGFTDGEGCFYVGFGYRKDLPLKWQIITEFHLSQNPSGEHLLEYFTKRLGCGYLKLNHAKSKTDKTLVLVVKDRKDLKEKLIPFFRKHSLVGSKAEDFEIFCKVLQIIEEKKHLTINGLKELTDIVFSSKRLTNKRYNRQFILSQL